MWGILYNTTSIVSFVALFVLGKVLPKSKYGEKILWVASLAVFIYKTVYYILQNVKGVLSIPVEISSISYFLTTVIFVFRIKKLHIVGAFFGIMSGLGYFLFYSVAGFTVINAIVVKDFLISCVMHGYLLVCGMYLFQKNKFHYSETNKIWITIFVMLCWALVFYDFEMRGLTFIYYVIKPQFLLLFENMGWNALLFVLYYTLIIIMFFFILKVFIKINQNEKKKVVAFHKDVQYRENFEKVDG